MLTLLLILIIIACALLVLIILAQNPKGGGLSNLGAGASQFLGARQTADFLEKATWYFGIGILAVVVFTYFLTTSPADQGAKSRLEGADWTPTSTQPVPNAPGPGGLQPGPQNQGQNPPAGNLPADQLPAQQPQQE